MFLNDEVLLSWRTVPCHVFMTSAYIKNGDTYSKIYIVANRL